MMTISSRAAATAFASLLLMSSAFAQTPAPAAAAPRDDEGGQKPRSAASLECSKEADAKGLHGKERKKFRSECKKTARRQEALPPSSDLLSSDPSPSSTRGWESVAADFSATDSDVPQPPICLPCDRPSGESQRIAALRWRICPCARICHKAA